MPTRQDGVESVTRSIQLIPYIKSAHQTSIYLKLTTVEPRLTVTTLLRPVFSARQNGHTLSYNKKSVTYAVTR